MPWPLNIGVAGMIAAAGVKNIASLSSLQPGGTAVPAVGGGAGGAEATPAQAAPAQTAISMNLQGNDLFTGAQVARLMK